jgi:uncharacterized protein YyaL (SSP411 family)
MIFKTPCLIILPLVFSVLIFINGSAYSTQIEEIQWHSYEDGMARSRFEKKKVFLHFTAAWCFYCGVMEKESFTDPAIISALNENFIPIKVDYDREEEISRSYRVVGLPDTIFIAEDGEIIGRLSGYVPPDQLKLILNSILTTHTQK